MLKKIIYLTISLLLIVIGGALFVIAPYHIYTLTLTEGVSTRFLVMNPSPKIFYDGQEFFYQADVAKVEDDKSLFRSLHFSNFQMPMPLNHPIFYMIPTIKIESSGPRLGASFFNGKNDELLSVMMEKNYKMETTSGDQKIFTLPLFRNHISRKSEEEVWRDLFYKKLSLPSNLGESFFDSLLALKSVTYSDLVYNLYILYNRNQIFPKDIQSIAFDPKTSHGLVELPSGDQRFRLERLLIMEKGIVYPILIKTRINNIAAENYRQKLLRETIYKMSTTDSAIPIYAEYKNISYNHRIDQQGMTYLYSAWSHDLNNRDYVRVIILFLERGKSNLKYLKPFYEYAYKRFGSNLSSETDLLLETADEKLKRRMKEEQEEEIKKEEGQNTARFEGTFTNPDEKIKYYLQKAKENKINSDD